MQIPTISYYEWYLDYAVENAVHCKLSIATATATASVGSRSTLMSPSMDSTDGSRDLGSPAASYTHTSIMRRSTSVEYAPYTDPY